MLASIVLSLLLANSETTSMAPDQYSFGDAFNLDHAIEVSDLLSQPSLNKGDQVVIKGTIDAVCDKKRCWMTILTKQELSSFRIKVDDGDFIFPLSAKGKTAYASGIIENWDQPDKTTHAYQLKATAVLIEH